MQKLRAIAVVALAALWVAVGAHCLLEQVSGFRFLRCDGPRSASPPGSHCSDEGCQTVESGQYLPTAQTATEVSFEMLLLEPLSLAEIALPADVSSGVVTAVPPDLPRTWQFSFRTALPARAPSSLS